MGRLFNHYLSYPLCNGWFSREIADVRLAQYETGARTPKAELTASLAHVLGVSPQALSVPDIDSYTGLLHTLFTLEDNYGLKVGEVNGEICLRVNVRQGKDAAELHKLLCAWQEQAGKLRTGKITQEEYDRWRYNYPKFDTSQVQAASMSQGLSELLMDDLKN